MTTPDLTGRPLGLARRQARALGVGLQVRLVDAPDGHLRVRSQEPAPGEPLPPDGSIRLEVAEPGWLRWLPAIYQGDGEGAEPFVASMLRGLQHLSTSRVVEPLEALHLLLDPETCPTERLGWLARFVDLPSPPDWPERARRRTIAHAATLQRLRGTAAGLKLFVSLLLERDVQIVQFDLGRPPFRLGLTARVGEARLRPHAPDSAGFVVVIDGPRDSLGDAELRQLRQLLDREKPARTRYTLAFQETPGARDWPTGMRIGVEVSRIGQPGARLPEWSRQEQDRQP